MANPEGKVITVGVTGASGAILAQAALRLLGADPRVARVHLVVTNRDEIGRASCRERV